MKRVILGTFALLFAVSISSCRDKENKAEDTMEDIEETKQEAIEDINEDVREYEEAVEDTIS